MASARSTRPSCASDVHRAGASRSRNSSALRRCAQDPHHHLWDHQGEPGPGRYLIDEIAEDVNSGHNIVKTVRRAFAAPQLAPAYASAVQPLPLRLP